MERGIRLYRNGQYEQAIPLLKEAHAADPDDFFIMVHLGVAYYGAGLYTDAVAIFEEARRINDENPDLHYNLGNAYLAIQELEHAREAFTRVLQLDAGYVEAERALAKLEDIEKAGAPTVEIQTQEQPKPEATPVNRPAPRAGPPSLTKSVILSPYCQAVLSNPSAVLHRVGRNGYQADEVEAIISELREYINAMVPQITNTMSDMERIQSQVDYYKQMEQAIVDALVSAQKTAEDVKVEARAQSQTIVREVEEQAERVAEAAEETRHAAEEERKRIIAVAEQRALQIQQEAEALQAQAQHDARTLLNDAESKAQQIYAAAEKAEREAAERAQTTIREANDEAYKILQGAEDMQATTERQMTDLRAQTQQEVDELKKQAQHEAERIIAAAELIRQQARQDAADITSNGQREADRLIAEAEGQAQDILQGVRSEAGRWHAIINDLQAQKQRVEQEWFALTNNFLARLQQEQQNLRMERRGEARCSLRVNVRISSENVKDVIARSEDLSAHGMRLVTDQNLPVGTSISLEMELPDGGEPVQCNGIVRWASALDGNGRNSFRLGISLSATHNEDAERLSKFLNTVAQPVN